MLVVEELAPTPTRGPPSRAALRNESAAVASSGTLTDVSERPFTVASSQSRSAEKAGGHRLEPERASEADADPRGGASQLGDASLEEPRRPDPGAPAAGARLLRGAHGVRGAAGASSSRVGIVCRTSFTTERMAMGERGRWLVEKRGAQQLAEHEREHVLCVAPLVDL